MRSKWDGTQKELSIAQTKLSMFGNDYYYYSNYYFTFLGNSAYTDPKWVCANLKKKKSTSEYTHL